MIRKFWWLLVLLTVPIQAGTLRLGRAQVKITPPEGMPMGGGFVMRSSTGIHDDLFCKALVLENGTAKAGIVVCDVESLHRPMVEAARALIHKTTGLRGANVMMTGTHTHSGPEMTPIVLEGANGAMAEVIRAYQSELPRLIARAVQQAEANLTPARLWAAIGQELGISRNRRYLMKDGSVRTNPGQSNPDVVRAVGPIDPDVAVLYFEKPDATPLATSVNFALHPRAWGRSDFSADFPGVVARLLADVKGGEMITLFTQGCSGNIERGYFERRDKQSGSGMANRIGTILAANVLQLYSRMEELPTGTLQVRSRDVMLPIPSFSDSEVEQARQVVARTRMDRDEPAFMELVHAVRVLNVKDRHKGQPIRAEVQAITIGDQFAWVGLPGEVFAELGMMIKANSPYRFTVVNELANDMLDYIPNRKAYAEGSYEVTTARCAIGCGEQLVSAAIELLADMAGRTRP